MIVRYVLAPQAALDLVEIWRYINQQTNVTIANRVESTIRVKNYFSCGDSERWPQSKGLDGRGG